MESPEPQESREIPSDYAALQDVFNKQAATKLPPHRSWDCAIDLLPGIQPPKGRINSLSIPERKAMENYIKEALQQGLIHPSTSPAASSSFFLGKKGGGLWPYVDYRAVNEHTVKLPYALPLVPAALEELHIFLKLDLRSAYNLVRIWEGNKWNTVLTTPAGQYEYQIMLDGLSNSSSIIQGFMNEVFLMLCCFFFTLYSSKKKLAHVTKTIKQHNS